MFGKMIVSLDEVRQAILTVDVMPGYFHQQEIHGNVLFRIKPPTPSSSIRKLFHAKNDYVFYDCSNLLSR
jgi:hypothetical protein